MEVKQLCRTFKFNDTILDDPNPKMTPIEVIDHYSNIYPELTTGVIEGESFDKDGGVVYQLKTVISDKG